MVTVAGTLASLVSLLTRLTVNADVVLALVRVTVPVATPPFSPIDPGLTETSSVGTGGGDGPSVVEPRWHRGFLVRRDSVPASEVL